jgi:CheY-like chemotaxis protein
VLLDEPEVELSGARGRILIIDDEPRVLSVLSRVLGGLHDVVAVTSAQEALEQLGRGLPFDVIVCDLLMPEMSGIDLYYVLEQQAPQLAQRMIFLSGGANTSVAGDFFSTVPNQALEKPPARMDLLRAIDRELGSRASYRPLPSAVVPRDPSNKPN